MVKHGGENWQEHHVDIIQTGGAASDGALDMTESTFVQIVHHLGEVICRVIEERQERGSHHFWTVLDHRSVNKLTYENLIKY